MSDESPARYRPHGIVLARLQRSNERRAAADVDRQRRMVDTIEQLVRCCVELQVARGGDVMGFVYVQTSYLRHPKIVTLSKDAILLHLASILWTAEHLTDGFVPDNAVTSLCNEAQISIRHRSVAIRRLVSAGLWDELPTGWHVHNFERHNRSSTRAVVEANRTAARERQQRARERASRRDD